MIGLDTNVIIRYLMKDDFKQFAKAEKLIELTIKKKESLHICLVVICEVVWVLKYHYKLTKEEICNFLGMLLHADHIEVENREIALNSFKEYQNSQADFADCIIGHTNRSEGCVTTFTFDAKAVKLASFSKL
jgi:predicted nucleic-acid-binding protein